MSAAGNFLIIDSCTARAPCLAQCGHIGESRARNRILSILLLNWSISGCNELSSVCSRGKGLISMNTFSDNLWIQHLQACFTRHPVHNPANVCQASSAFWILGRTLAVPEFFFGLDCRHDSWALVFHVVLLNIFGGILKTVTDERAHAASPNYLISSIGGSKKGRLILSVYRGHQLYSFTSFKPLFVSNSTKPVSVINLVPHGRSRNPST